MRLVSFEPDIAANLGALIRICSCFDVPLDVVEPCGFPFSIKALRRAAMDYIENVDIERHNDWDSYQVTSGPGRLVLLTTKGATNLWDFRFQASDRLLLGRESAGVPESIHQIADARVAIPMPGGGRSLNVAVSAGIVLAEALRQMRGAAA